MSNNKITNCGDCAYAQKSDGKIWCKFYDVEVNPSLVCDDFLNEFDSPQWISLSSGMTDNSQFSVKTQQYTKEDIFAYFLTAVLFASAIFVCCVPL